MKGLLLNDLYMALKYCRAFFFAVIVFGVMAVIGDETDFFVMYSMLLASMTPITLMSYDEKSGWNVYQDTFPYTRCQMVSVKYVVALVSMGIAWVISIASMGVSILHGGTMVWPDYFIFALNLLAVGLIVSGLLLPVVFQYGCEKGRIVYYIIFIVFGAGVAILEMTYQVQTIMEHLYIPLLIFPPMLIVFAIGFFVLSWLVSVKIYKNREL